MRIAVCGRHYTGMATLTVVPQATVPSGFMRSSMDAVSVARWLASVRIVARGVALRAEPLLVRDEARQACGDDCAI